MIEIICLKELYGINHYRRVQNSVTKCYVQYNNVAKLMIYAYLFLYIMINMFRLSLKGHNDTCSIIFHNPLVYAQKSKAIIKTTNLF